MRARACRSNVAAKARASAGQALCSCIGCGSLFVCRNIISAWLKQLKDQPSDPLGLHFGHKLAAKAKRARSAARGSAAGERAGDGRVLGICPKRRALFLYKNIISVWLKHWTGQPSDPFGLNSNPDPSGFKLLRKNCQSSI